MKKYIKIENLIVNPENYRFDPVDNQDKAIDLMINEKGRDILNLAKHIIDNGLDPAKDFRVMKSGSNNYIVLDGNRRITAIKCLLNPILIKDEKLKKSFYDLIVSQKKPIKNVSCYIYSNEKEAAKWIKLDHTGKNEGVGQDSWGSAEVDRFGYKFEGKISPAMQLVNLVEKELRTKVNTGKLKITTINRILSNPVSRSILGIDVKKGVIDFVAEKKDVVNNTKKLFDKVIRDDVRVDEVYSKEKGIAFMSNLFGVKDENTNKEVPTVYEIPQSTVSMSKTGTTRSNPKTTSRQFLIPSHCVLVIDVKKAPKINNIYCELKNDLLLNDSNEAVPNAVGVLFRVFLEVSLDYYAINNGGHHFKKEDTINIKIGWVVESMIKKGFDNKIFKNINKVGSSQQNQSYLSIYHFHDYVHSSTVQPTPGELKAKWDNLQGFFEALWSSLGEKKDS